MTDTQRNYRKFREGTVVSTKMDKTLVVRIDRNVQHSMYSKVIRRSKNVKVHFEDGEFNVGDVVRIMETRPISKTKCWRYVSTVRKAVIV